MNSSKIENETKKVEGDLRLHDAVCDPDNKEEIETLVSEEPKLIWERDQEGRTPLHTIAFTGDEEAVEIAKILVGVNDEDTLSIDRPEILNVQDSQNFTPLHLAARGRQVDLVEAFLKWGANPAIQDANGNTPLHYTAEGNTEKAVEVAQLILSHDTKKTLINALNHEQKTPLHMAVNKKALRMVQFLLQPNNNKCSLNMKNAMGRNILHHACSSIGESESSCNIVRALLERCTKGELNQGDMKGRTPLHLAAMARFPKIVKILVDDERTDVTKRDEKGRMALHYSAEDGCYTKGYHCVEALIDRQFPKYADQVQYLFKVEDHLKNTPFMYAVINCPAETMQKYVGMCPKPQYWLTSFYMTLIYKNCPVALKPLMDKAFTEDQDEKHEGEDGIATDFGIITGYIDPVEQMPQQETKYLKQALWWEYNGQKEVLLHPLTQYFVAKKWGKLKSLVFAWIAWQIIWLLAYTTVGISYYAEEEEKGAKTEPDAPSIWVYISAGVMAIFALGSLINEIFELCTIGSAYLLSVTNMFQLIQILLGFIAVSPIFMGYNAPFFWMKYTTAFGILLAYILSMRGIGKLHEEVGYIVEVLKQVLIRVMQVLICCAPLCLGFTIAFMIVLEEETLQSAFPGPLVKILVMMTGEFEYNDTFKDEEGGKAPLSPLYKFLQLLLFSGFLIAVPVGFFNGVLSGFALDKVMELREKANVARVAKQLEHIYFIESILMNLRPLRKIMPHATIVHWLRKLNVTSQWFNTESGRVLKFETLIKERIRKSDRNFKRNTGCGLLCAATTKYCKSGLSPEVLAEIYVLATPSNMSN